MRGAVNDALARAGLLDEVADNLDHPALRLSGGQQQRLCIARALAADPEVLLLDEPCSALDPVSTRVIEDLIIKLREDVAVVIVTHNLQQAYRVADYVAFMYLGELVEYGSAQKMFGSPARAADEGVRRAVPSVRRMSAACAATLPRGGAAHRLRVDADGGRSRPARRCADHREPEPDRGHAGEPCRDASEHRW